mgnify:CR=1 FL=1
MIMVQNIGYYKKCLFLQQNVVAKWYATNVMAFIRVKKTKVRNGKMMQQLIASSEGELSGPPRMLSRSYVCACEI